MKILLSLVAIIVCGALGAAVGWMGARALGLAGTPAALVAVPIAMVVAVAAWAAGVVACTRLVRRDDRDTRA